MKHNNPLHLLTRFYLPALILLFASFSAKASSWRDPSWKYMLDNSKVVALVQYTSTGTEQASARIITVYKGTLKPGSEIWISGFSDQYGPYDEMHSGDRYLVFLNPDRVPQDYLRYMEKEAAKDVDLKKYLAALKSNSAYSVWTPTAGDFKVTGDKVQYNLMRTSCYKCEGDFYSLAGFEAFLNAYYKKQAVAAFHSNLLHIIHPPGENKENTQLLMQLALTGYNRYQAFFEAYTHIHNPETRFALTCLLGNIHSAESKQLLIALLSDSNDLVKEEAINLLSNEPAAIVGPILLQHLPSALTLRSRGRNIMNPIRNYRNGNRYAIIAALAKLNYKPAIPALLKLLDTDQPELFMAVIDALKAMNNKDYIPYLNKHLDKKTENLVNSIIKIIVEDRLTECLPALKNFITTCNRNKHPGYDYALHSQGIGRFKDPATIQFLLADYQRFFATKDTLRSDQEKRWTISYLEAFTYLKLKQAKPLAYKAINDWIGVDKQFVTTPSLFAVKQHLEDSLRKTFTTLFAAKRYKISQCLAFIQNSAEVASGKAPRAKFLLEATIPYSQDIKGAKEAKIAIAETMNLPQANVYISFGKGLYFLQSQQRFDASDNSWFIYHFLNYIQAVPEPSDIGYLQTLLDRNFITEEVYQHQARKIISQIKAQAVY